MNQEKKNGTGYFEAQRNERDEKKESIFHI